MNALRTAAALGGVALLVVFLRLPALGGRICDPDVGGIYYAAWDLLSGGTIYERCVETKPPGAYALTALGLGLADMDLDGPVWVHALWQAAGAVALALLAARLAGGAAGLLAGLLFALFHVHPAVQGLCGEFAAWAAPPTIFAFYAFERARSASLSTEYGRGRAWDFAFGAFAAAALLMKQTAVFSFLFLPLWWLWRIRRDPSQRLIVTGGLVRGHLVSPAGAILAGAAAVAAGTLAFYAARGGMAEMFEALRPGRVAGYLGTTDASLAGPIRARLIAAAEGLWPLAALAAMGLRTPGAGLAALWLAGAAFGVASGSKYFLHYFAQALPPLALLAAMGGLALLRAVRPRALGAAALAALALATAWPGVAEAARALASRAAEGEWPGARDEDARLQDDFRRLGAYVASETREVDGIFVWDYAPELYLYAMRRAPTRHYMYWDTTVGHPYGWHPHEDAVVLAARAELMRDLRANPPAFIVAFDPALAPRRIVKPFFPELEEFVAEHYAPEPARAFGPLLLWRLRAAG